MPKNISMRAMIMEKMMNNLVTILVFLFLAGCSISPGMHMETQRSWNDDSETVYIESINKYVPVINITEAETSQESYSYKIGNGDQISITIWGLPDIFPISNISPDQNLRRVDSQGNIYFPYAGLIKATGKTQNELRQDLGLELSKYFNDPQVDVSIARFNSQKVYLLGEVTVPSKINVTDIPLTLSDALGEVKGVSTTTGDGSDIFIIRQSSENPLIFRANLSTPSGFIGANKFYLENNDIVYVNAKSTTRWNRVISQFFPFSSFLNSIDNLTQD